MFFCLFDIFHNINFYLFTFFSYRIRIFASFFTSFLISLFLGFYLINLLNKFNIYQIIRINGPKTHYLKNKTPTMGGIVIIISIFLSVLFWSYSYNHYIKYIFIILFSYGLIGLIDDYFKLINKNSNGISVKYKYFFQSIIAFILSFLIYYRCKNVIFSKFIFSYFKFSEIQLDIFYIILFYFVITGTSNAVNLTDGLDGLVVIPIILVFCGFLLISYFYSDIYISSYFNIPYLCNARELVIFCSSVIGSCLGFLWFNFYPAKIFMGDVGSLALGGSLSVTSILLHQEFLLFIMGGLFVLETLSVILQVFVFRFFGKKIFLMAPIHHHFELKGYFEPNIVIRFWIISLIFVLFGLFIFGIH
ncbi:phospho-N-acetylmuramoyl-pentapeptide-transferase [Candidatus Purcelliella pentastirinorum]|uniref:Phospho-N-acetylmuramoyl-pentapeptide-transferase n=1 Tax=Candidatus Purcelliella pentastirinorum TaxID=472834 RepID=A0AAX3N8E3_9ENTR|nr:phospho-N-acetylmuramoyl-pentapeptide-transferase [Candidatus Purcelliella pentastirinorum]WDI78653.1 phospho-N-acetylmuramoyl-pentapeptide-transferase [Candidatus Purcelliella pentastirinorum]WDR80320.1 phospho-N-acetylmuramoyl-pentapeptide-transferase [Candidatus Purcelliella pentastirinorum]